MEKGFWAVVRREIKRILSDRIYLISAVAAPIFAYLFFTGMFAEGLPAKMPVAYIDNDNTALSRNFIRQAGAMSSIDFSEKLTGFSDAETEMKKGNIYAFIIIPPDFQADLLSAKQPQITFYYNNAYLIPGSLLYKDLTLISATISTGVALNTGIAKGVASAQLMAQLQPIAMDTHLIGNPYTNYSVYLSTVLIPGILQLIILLVTVYAIGIELKEKTSCQWLLTANRSIIKAIGGKLLPYTIIFITLAIANSLIFYHVLDFSITGNLIITIAASVLLVLAEQAIAITFIGIMPVLRNALSIAAVIGILGISFTGFTFPIEQMPLFIRPLAELFPLRHFFIINQNNTLLGTPVIYYFTSFIALILFVLLPFITIVRLKRTLIHNNFEVE